MFKNIDWQHALAAAIGAAVLAITQAVITEVEKKPSTPAAPAAISAPATAQKPAQPSP